MASVTIPVSLGGTNVPYNDGSGAYGMTANAGYGYRTYLVPMLSEVIAACAVAVSDASTAVDAAAEAEASRDAIDNRIYPGTYGSDPTTRPDGSAMQDGDQYTTTAGVVKVRGSGVWAAVNVNMTSLAASAGSSLVGYDSVTVQDVLDSARPMASYTTLRNYTGRATSIRITQSGISGYFWRDDSDTTSADNGGTIIVASNGKRWKRIYDGAISVRWFGAEGDGVTNDATAIQAAIDLAAATAPNGGEVYMPSGTYIIGTTTLDMGRYVKLFGAGKKATQISYSGTGNAIEMISPINSSTGVFTVARDFSVNMTNAANTGAGYVDVGGTFVELTNVGVYGGLYGLIFDQTELADVDLCEFSAQLAGGAGVWLANGTYTPGASPAFTNRISVTRCQINQGASTYCVADDGGYVHTYSNNNINGGLSHFRFSSVEVLTVDGNECEASTAQCVRFEITALNGTSLSGCTSVNIKGNAFVPAAAQVCISVAGASIGPLTVGGNLFSSVGATAMITGGSLISALIDQGNNIAGSPFLNGTPTILSRAADTSTWTPSVKIGGIAPASQTVSLGVYSRVGNVVTCSMDVSLSTKGGLTGSISISGLPYAEKSGTLQFVPPPFVTGLVTSTSVGVYVSGSALNFFNSNWNYSAALSDANISDTTRFAMTFSYIAD